MAEVSSPEGAVPVYRNRWRCELCDYTTPPLIGNFIAGARRHHCRLCGRTVCNACSSVLAHGKRSCRVCCPQEDASKTENAPREKYVFLVRHAQSTWNQNVDMVKTFRTHSLEDISFKDVVSRAAHLMAREVWHKDHPISAEGVRQAEELRQKILEARQSNPDESQSSSSATGSASSSRRCSESERQKRYYDRFLVRRQRIYCSPLLRALQTAHLALPEEDGWGSIKLLKDARERFSLRIERDCLGELGVVGPQIIDRAMRMGQELPGLEHRVDSSDCAQKWWSDEPESEAEVEVRLKSLWRRLLEEDGDDSCVLVTHSNLIKALLMYFGGVDEDDNVEHAESDAWGCGIEDHDLNYIDGGTARSELETCCGTAPKSYAAGKTGGCGASRSKPSVKDASCAFRLGVADGIDVGSDENSSEPEENHMGDTAWQVVARSSEALRRVKIERLQNCGVLGLRCELEAPAQRLYPEVDGWVDLNEDSHIVGAHCMAEPRWVARDALLMFDSVLVN